MEEKHIETFIFFLYLLLSYTHTREALAISPFILTALLSIALDQPSWTSCIKMVVLSKMPSAYINSDLFHVYCYFQIAITHGLDDFHLHWNLENALDRWQWGPYRVRKESKPSWWRITWPEGCPCKTSRRVQLIQRHQPFHNEAVDPRIYTGIENNKYISIQNHPHQSTASSNIVCRREVWGSLDSFYDNYNATHMFILPETVTYKVTTSPIVLLSEEEKIIQLLCFYESLTL